MMIENQHPPMVHGESLWHVQRIAKEAANLGSPTINIMYPPYHEIVLTLTPCGCSN